jgi:ATP-dependent Clp protease adaptor protein ClpS
MPKHNPHLDEETLVEEEKQALKPPLYKVLMHNDDFTTMEFVVFVLIEIFHKSEAAAEQIMYAVHRKGLGVAGVFTREIAEAKINQVYNLARAHEFPLLCTMEEE